MLLTGKILKQAIASAVAVYSALALVSPARAALIVDIQPVQICLDNGSSCGAMSFESGALESYWLDRAGITLNILDARTFDSTTFQTMNTVTEASSFVTTNPSADPLAPVGFLSGPVTIWFSDEAFGSGPRNVAMIDGNRSWVASNLSATLQTVFLAQAIGHNLGLSTISSSFDTNLMTSVIQTTATLGDFDLFSEQIDIVQASRFGYEAQIPPIPEPEIYAMMGLGLGVLGWAGRRRKHRAE